MTKESNIVKTKDGLIEKSTDRKIISPLDDNQFQNRCSYCKISLIHKDDEERHCPKERWYTFGLHPKSHNGYYAYPASHDSVISYVRLILRRIRYIFE